MGKFINRLPWIRRRKDRELERELRYHLDRRIDELRASGLVQAEARRRARLELGGVVQVKEAVRDTWTHRWLDELGLDIRYGIRVLRRSPGFTVTAILSLALGIGANAAIFSLIDQVLLRRLPIVEPESIVQLDWVGNSVSATWGGGHLMSYPLCRDLQGQEEYFGGVFCRAPTQVSFSTGDESVSVRAEIVSGSYFEVLGVTPELGRLIDGSDDVAPGAHPVVVLSHDFWQNRLGGAPEIIGRRVLINDYPLTVIGIAPAPFGGMDPLAPAALWIPAMMTAEAAPLERGWNRMLDRRVAWMHVFARLAPGVHVDDPRPDLQGWFASMLEEDLRGAGFPDVTPEQRSAFLASSIDVLPAARGVSNLRAVLERPLLVLMSGTLLLLLLASFNVGGLLLARGAARGGELATRMALGASRRRITGQLLVESLLLTLAGNLVGLMAVPAMSSILLALLTWSDDLHARFDSRALLFGLVSSAVAAGVCSLVPLLQTSRVPLIASLKEQSRSATGARVRLRKALVVAQMALTLLLLTGAGLFVQTLRQLHAQVGFDDSGLVMLSVSPSAIGYSEQDAEQAMREVLRQVRQVPAVERVAVANTLMLSGGWSTRNLTIQSDRRIVTDGSVPYMRVGPGFFSTLGIEFVAGSDFDANEMRPPGAAPRAWRTAIVNESFARRYVEGRSPIGSRLGVGNRPDTVADIEIVGVVRDFSRRSLRDGPVEHVFFPYWDHDSDGGTVYVKVRGEPESTFPRIRAAVEQVDRELPVSTLTTYADQIDRSTWSERALATLVTAFGAIALLLTVVGLYGVVSYVATERRREIGVRIALGATRTAAIWLIVRDSLIMIGVATMVAIPCAWGLRRLVEALLFGVSATDGPTIGLAGSLLVLAVLVAALIPAWRAASRNPTAALRLE